MHVFHALYQELYMKVLSVSTRILQTVVSLYQEYTRTSSAMFSFSYTLPSDSNHSMNDINI